MLDVEQSRREVPPAGQALLPAVKFGRFCAVQRGQNKFSVETPKKWPEMEHYPGISGWLDAALPPLWLGGGRLLRLLFPASRALSGSPGMLE